MSVLKIKINGQWVTVGETKGTAESVSWENVTDKPESYPPSEHTHKGAATEEYVDDAVSKKVEKVDGMGLSANDFTDEEKEKLESIDPDGYVSKAGDTITGNLTVRNPEGHNNPFITLISDNLTYNSGGGESYALLRHYTDNDISTEIRNVLPLGDGTSHQAILQLGNSRNFSAAQMLRLWEYEPDGTKNCYDVYHEGNKPTVDDITGSVKIETGTYVGTGNYGEDYKNIITFKGKPMLVFINDGHWWFQASFYRSYNGGGCGRSIYATSAALHVSQLNTSWSENSLTWFYGNSYSSNETGASLVKLQLNSADVTYMYIAICI